MTFIKTTKGTETFYTFVAWDFDEDPPIETIAHEHHDSRGNVLAWDQSPIEERPEMRALHDHWVACCSAPK